MIPSPLTLVILAAGRSTRFGRLKQLTPIGPGGEALLDYALHDGVLAGFTRFVLVVQEDRQGDFDAHLAPAVAAGLDVRYVYQRLTPGAGVTPAGRTRPWGTGHAVLTAAEHISGSFALCNADDFYGRSAFKALADAIREGERAAEGGSPLGVTPAITVGYPLSTTLSDSGGVSRGICEVDETGTLQRLSERFELRRSGNRVRGRDLAGGPIDVPLGTLVCTNLWGFPETGGRDKIQDDSVNSACESSHKHNGQRVDNTHSAKINDESVTQDDSHDHSRARAAEPGILGHLNRLFSGFLASEPGLDREFYLTEAVNDLIAAGLVHCAVIPTRATWLGVTFPDDHPRVAESLRALSDAGAYPMRLWDAAPTPVFEG